MSVPLLAPDELVRLKGLEVRARAVAEGVFSGLHRSVHRGASRDFSDHKEYSPGDDIRNLDWKAYARFDRPLIRRYETETERGCLILLDVSSSMDFGAGPLTKLDFARVTAAALAFVLLGQRDRVGLGVLGNGFRLAVPVRRRGDQLAALLSSLERAGPDGEASPAALADGLADAAEAAPRRSLVVVLSDLLDPRPELPAALRRLATSGRELAVFQLLSPEEETFPYDGFRAFHSPELPEERLQVDARSLRRTYLHALGALRESVSRASSEAGFTLLTRSTDVAPAGLILDWVGARDPAGLARAQGRADR
ncbi:MAG: DUF58 domain-containing protein [bacterium]